MNHSNSLEMMNEINQTAYYILGVQTRRYVKCAVEKIILVMDVHFSYFSLFYLLLSDAAAAVNFLIV